MEQFAQERLNWLQVLNTRPVDSIGNEEYRLNRAQHVPISSLSIRRDRAIHEIGTIQPDLSNTVLIDTKSFVLENWLARSEIGRNERNMGLANAKLRDMQFAPWPYFEIQKCTEILKSRDLDRPQFQIQA